MTTQLDVPVLGPYTIVKPWKTTGTGVTYEAIDTAATSPSRTSVLIHVIDEQISLDPNFITRFKLLQTILPTINHKNLITYETLAKEGNIYYVAKRVPVSNLDELKAFEGYDFLGLEQLEFSLTHIFQELSKVLTFLLNIHNAYYQNGIVMEALSMSSLYIFKDQKKPYPTILVDGIAEPFLYFGDQAPDLLSYHLNEALQLSQQTTNRKKPVSFLKEQSLYPPERRYNAALNERSTIYTYGSILYQALTGEIPKGIYPSLTQLVPTLDSSWDTLVERCLTSEDRGGFSNLKDLGLIFQKQIQDRGDKVSIASQLQKLSIPDKMALVYVPDKVYLGAEDGPLNEQPCFRARLKPFFIDIFPVTCEDFMRFMKAYQPSTYARTPQHPATLVSWNNAKAYCDWRSEKEGLPLGSYRLPTEYEWEVAVRSGTTDHYPWGPEIDANLLYCERSTNSGAVAIKQYPSGRFGIYDMLGNVWEWTASDYKPHPISKHLERWYQKDLRVVKGGCWMTPLKLCRASLRSAFAPHEKRGNVSFRCVRPIDVTTLK